MTKRILLAGEIEKLRGATATLWSYSVSHQTLTLRLQFSDSENTHLVCGGCIRIEAPTHCIVSHLQISIDDPEIIILTDVGAGMRIECLFVQVEHNVQPIYRQP